MSGRLASLPGQQGLLLTIQRGDRTTALWRQSFDLTIESRHLAGIGGHRRDRLGLNRGSARLHRSQLRVIRTGQGLILQLAQLGLRIEQIDRAAGLGQPWRRGRC